MKIILFANTDWYLYNYRLPLARALKDDGHTVILLSPDGKYAERIRQAGFDLRKVNLSRRGLNPFVEWATIQSLLKIYKDESPDLVHHFTIKCILYGSLAAKHSQVPRVVNAVTGLGYIFSTRNLFTLVAKPIVLFFYRRILKSSFVIFQNESDQKYFIEKKLVTGENSTLIPGSGVDTLRFTPAPNLREKKLVVLPARMLWDKGIREFVEASAILKRLGITARFVLAGDVDEGNPSSISKDQLARWEKESLVEWWGWQEDMVRVYQRAEVVCLPSYSEGLAKSLIEAAACGSPLVASDIPGCREVVKHGVNGFLVPKGDGKALADALVKCLKDEKQLERMAKASREIAVREYSVEKIISATVSVYNI